MRNVRTLLATGLGTGYLPVAPGTWGSIAVAGIYLALAWPAGALAGLASVVMAVLAVAASVVCVALGPFAETHFGRKDPSQVTIDEWAGQALALIAMPLPTDWTGRLIVAASALLAFRVFDVVKPPPANAMQRLPAGWGILADDLIAAVYANAAAQLLLRLVLGINGIG